ncbi:MAG: CDP-archaeol synthase [Flavobacteriaceae bacterium]|nr:CDP-archaeol synthase [Flavobacteriaceae bacterium]
MNETLTRSLSGLVYITILISAIFFSNNGLLFAGLMFVFAGISCWEFNNLLKVNNFRTYFQLVIIAYFTYLALTIETQSSNIVFFILAIGTLVTHLFLTNNLFKLKKIKENSVLKQQLPLLYVLIPFSLLALTPSIINNTYNPYIIFGILIIIWSNDTFAYLIGKNFGRRKLFEKISPKKTKEGFIGGMLFGIIAALIIAITTSSLSILHWMVLSIIISIFGTIGDLVASKFKREANIKDSSNLIPGHGGFLDRLDSLIFVSSFVYLYLQLINYVS